MQILTNSVIRKNIYALFIIILLIGSVLRFYGLEIQSFWKDELHSWKSGTCENLYEVINRARSDVHPPGYHILLYLVEKYIGDTEAILRFPSAVSGVLTIFVIFLLGLYLYSHKEALISSALMAVLWCPVYYSQEARPYSMLLLSTMVATYCWIKMLRELNEKESVSYYISGSYCIAAIISSYLHYFGLYLIFLQGLGITLLFSCNRRVLFFILLTYSAIMLAYLPWVPTMLQQAQTPLFHILMPTRYAFWGYLKFLFNNSRSLTLLVLILYSFLFISSFFTALRTKTYTNLKSFLLSSDMLIILWLVVPFIGAYVESNLSTPILQNRNLIISLPAAYLLLSRSITKLPISSHKQVTIAVVLVGVFLLQLIVLQQYYSKPHKQQIREAANFIIKQDYLNDDSLIIDHIYDPAFLNYYFEKAGSKRRASPEVSGMSLLYGAWFLKINGKKAEGEKLLESMFNNVANAIQKRNSHYIWYVCEKPNREYFDFLNRNLKLIDHKMFIEAEVFLFEKNNYN